MYVGNVEGKQGKKRLIRSTRLCGVEWWTRKYILADNFDEILL